jgi:hypothetical protein
MAKITAMEEKRKKLGLTPAQFYAAPRQPESKSTLPIFDKSHARNAMARFNQVDFESQTEQTNAYNKVLKAALKFGVNVDEFKKRKPK